MTHKKERLLTLWIVSGGTAVALLVIWAHLAPHVRKEITQYDRVQMQRLLDDISR